MVNPNQQYWLYSVVGCSEQEVKVLDKYPISKSAIGYLVILLDVIMMAASVFFIWYLENKIQNNLEADDSFTL